MILLAIECSQRHGNVALLRDDAVDREPLRPGARHDDDLLPAVDRLVRRAGLAAGDLDVVAVSIGPGGFTGLRVAICTAKAIAEVRGTRVVAVPTALVVAESHEGPAPVVVALASKRDTVWATRANRVDEGWTVTGTPGLVRAEELDLEEVAALLADEHLPAAARGRAEDAGVAVLEPRFEAAALAAVARRLAEAGCFTDPLHLAPLYPREPEAVRKWRRGGTSG